MLNHAQENRPPVTLEVARGFWSRFRGWMGRRPLPGTALLIYPCSSVHTFFMLEPIDIVFVDRQGQVLSVMERLGPWRVSPWVREAAAVIEMPAGSAASLGFRAGKFLPAPWAEIIRTIMDGS